MSFRVSTAELFANSQNDIQNQLFNISVLEQQLSSGKKVSSPSDAPTTYNIIASLNEQVSQQTVFNSNISDAQASANAAQGALTTMNSYTSQIATLYVEGQNEAKGPQDRLNIVQQINQIIVQAVQTANTAVNNKYLFGGTDTQTPPFVIVGNPTAPTSVSYVGNGGFIPSQVGPITTLNTNLPGSNAFDGGSNTFANIFTTMINIRDDFQSNMKHSLISTNNSPFNVNAAFTINTENTANHFATPPVINGQLSFQVNGVTINYNTTNAASPYGAADSVNTIIAKINANVPNVTASWDPTTNRVFIQSTQGRLVTVQDVVDANSNITGNIATGTFELADNLSQITAAQNLISTDQSALAANTVTLNGLTTAAQSQGLLTTQEISQLQDTNVATTVSQFTLQQTAYQAALDVGSRILPTTLFNLIQ